MNFWPTDAEAICSALYAWVNGQIGTGGAIAGFAAAPYAAMWGYQDAPHPQYPYAVLVITQPPSTVGGVQPERVLTPGLTTIERTEYDARMVVQVELLSRAPLKPSSGLDETFQLASGLEGSLQRSDVLEALDAAGVAFIETRPILALTAIAGFGFERRTRLSVVFGVRVRIDFANPPLLDQPDVTATVDGDGNVTGLVQGS